MKAKIVFSRERARTHLKVGEVAKLQEGDSSVLRKVFSKFCVDDAGEYLTPEAGLALIDDLSIGEYDELALTAMEDIKNALVPPAKPAA